MAASGMGRDVAGETYYPGLAASDMEGEGGGHQYFGEGTNIWGRVPIFGEGTNISEEGTNIWGRVPIFKSFQGA